MMLFAFLVLNRYYDYIYSIIPFSLPFITKSCRISQIFGGMTKYPYFCSQICNYSNGLATNRVKKQS